MSECVSRQRLRFVLAAIGSLLCLPGAAHAQMPPASAPVAVVGGEAITQSDYQSILEKQAGKAVLNKLVYTLLVRQAAAKANLLPTDAQVTARIVELARRSPQLAAQAQDPAAGRGFREDVRTDMALENLRIENVTATEAEITAFYTAQTASFTLPTQVQTTMVVTRTKTDAAHAESLLRQGMPPDEIALQPRLKVAGVNGFNVNMDSMPPADRQAIGKTVLAMKAGQIQTMPAGAYFVTFLVKAASESTTPPLAQIHELVARQARLAKAISPQQEIARLYANNPPKFSDPKYQAYFEDLNTVSQAR